MNDFRESTKGKMCPKTGKRCSEKCAWYLELLRKNQDGTNVLDAAGNPVKDGTCIDVWKILTGLR